MKINKERLTQIANEAIDEFNIVGAQISVALSEEVIECAVGVSNVSTGIPVEVDTLFQIGSTTKLFTAALVMQLADRGEIDIDAPVSSYLQNFEVPDPIAGSTITPRHLMSMSSGLDNGPYLDTGRGDCAVQKSVDVLKDLPIVFQPGEAFSYSNASTNVSGLLVEKITGMNWDDALRKQILEPAGLLNSASLPEDQIYHRVAVGHKITDAGIEHSKPWIFARGSGPAGSSLACSAGDLVRFGQLFLRNGISANGTRILSEKSVALMHTKQVDVETKWFADGWCVGPYLKKWDGVQIYGHSGTTLCGSSTLVWIPEMNASVAITVNVANRGYHFADRVFEQIFEELLGIKKPSRPVGSNEVKIDFESYTGNYATAHIDFSVFTRDRRLHVTAVQRDPAILASGAPKQVTTELLPIGENRFMPADDSLGSDHLWDVAFVIDDEGQSVRFVNGAFAARRIFET